MPLNLIVSHGLLHRKTRRAYSPRIVAVRNYRACTNAGKCLGFRDGVSAATENFHRPRREYHAIRNRIIEPGKRRPKMSARLDTRTPRLYRFCRHTESTV